MLNDKDQNIIDQIFGFNGHRELVKESKGLLRYLIDENLLTDDILGKIFSGVSRGVLENRLTIYKLFEDVSTSLKSKHKRYLLE